MNQICPRCSRAVADNDFIWEQCSQCDIDDAARAHRHYYRRSFSLWLAAAAVFAILSVMWWRCL